MKKLKTGMAILASAVMIWSCSGSSGNSLSQQLDSLKQYIDSVSSTAAGYTAEKWEAIKEGYNAKAEALEGSKDNMSEEMKQQYAGIQEKYSALENTFKEKMKEQADNDYKKQLRASLFGEGMVGDDMKFNFVTADNIRSYYERFVNTVDKNQNNYTREDWDEIKLLYEALDTRKNEVEKNLSSKDNMAIAKLKIKFSAIKSIKRPFSKIKENEEAKQ